MLRGKDRTLHILACRGIFCILLSFLLRSTFAQPSMAKAKAHALPDPALKDNFYDPALMAKVSAVAAQPRVPA